MANPYHEGVVVSVHHTQGKYLLFGGSQPMEPITDEAIVIYPDTWHRTSVSFNSIGTDGHAGHQLVNKPAMTQEQVRKLVEEYERMQPILRAEEEQRRMEEQQQKEQQRQQYREQHPQLTQVSNTNMSSYAVGAKNMRRELTEAFPGVKFSVRSESYSGGCSIRVSWTDGPSRDDVEKITNKYQYGWFDGMEDLYNYSDEVWTDVFGGAKYVSCDREISNHVMTDVAQQIAKDMNVEFTDMNQMPPCESANSVFRRYERWYDVVRRFVAKKNLMGYAGVVPSECTCGTWPDEFYEVVYG